MNAIEEIETFQLTDGLPHVIVRIRDSDGSIGFGECWWEIPTPSDPKRKSVHSFSRRAPCQTSIPG